MLVCINCGTKWVHTTNGNCIKCGRLTGPRHVEEKNDNKEQRNIKRGNK